MLQCNAIESNSSIRAALYARVSSDHQANAGTIQSQIDVLLARAAQDQLTIETELRFIDDGVSGATLIRPALEKLRDAAAAGAIDRLYVLCPDRLSRQYAHQMVLIEELGRCGVQVLFVNHQLGKTPEDNLLLQMQGMIAEYERAKILERSRRGKLHGARAGKLSVMGRAPYGYRYVPGESGCAPWYNVHLPEASTVKQIFQLVGMERKSLRQVCRTLEKQGILSPSGMSRWSASSLKCMLGNPAYKGAAAYGKTCRGPMRARLRPVRGSSGIPRGGKGVYHTSAAQWIAIAVPAIVEESLFERAGEQLKENRKYFRQRRSGPSCLLQGLLVCTNCGYACFGTYSGPRSRITHHYYRCQGSMPCRCNGQRLCDYKPIRQDLLDQAVWNDVRQLLSDPARVQRELQRRLDGNDADAQQQMHKTASAGEQGSPRHRAPDRCVRAAAFRQERVRAAHQGGSPATAAVGAAAQTADRSAGTPEGNEAGDRQPADVLSASDVGPERGGLADSPPDHYHTGEACGDPKRAGEDRVPGGPMPF